MITLVSVAFFAFVVTNIDDFVMLNLFFGGSYKKRHIVVGQFLGIGILIALSIMGAVISTTWIHNNSIIGFLGLMPIAIGLYALRSNEVEDDNKDPNKGETGWWQAVSVCSLTISGGYDNLAVYIPLFASVSMAEMGTIAGIFFILTGLWCFGAYWFTKGLHYVGRIHLGVDDITGKLEKTFPLVLILLGTYILYTNNSLPYLAEQIAYMIHLFGPV